MKYFPKFTPNKTLTALLLLGVAFSVVTIINAAAQNPGHPFTEVGTNITAGQIIYGSGADTLAALSSVAAGSYLRSGGVATAPVWSTPTLPNTATLNKLMVGNGTNWVESTPTFPNASAAVGKTVRSDGTNWIASTATLSDAPSTAGKAMVSDGTNWIASTPTFPNASATSRKIIVSDGTNWTASTETYAVPGTNGNLMQSNGTNWTSATPPAASGLPKYNQSVTTPAAGFAADTYLVGSSITIAAPATTLKVGSRYHLIFNVSKTAAGLATPIINIRYGTGGAVGDASKCALTWTAQTAATDTGTFEIWATFRTIGSGTTAVLQCAGQRRHGASITGLGTLVAETKVATSAGFDSTVANSILGASVNGGASAAWTITNVNTILENIN